MIKLFLSATNVRTGKVAVFTNKEITADHVLASACLPFMMRAPDDRRRGLLGRRLHGKSGDLSGDLRLPIARTSSSFT